MKLKKVKKFGKGGQNKPIITNDPKDERLKAYNDSLNLYNDYLKADSSLSTISNVKRVDLGNNIEYSLPYAVNDNTNTRIFYNQLQGNNSRNVLNFNHDYTIAGYGNKRHYTTFSLEKEQKPVQPIVYQPEEKKTLKEVRATSPTPYKMVRGVDGIDRIEYLPERPKEQPINIQSFKADLLQGSDINMFNPIPFEKGTYFTRERQPQEAGSKQFGRKGKTDYFDKKTGRSMGIYANGGGVNRYDVPAQMPTGQQFFQLPYNELAASLATKQKAYDTQEAEMAENQAFLADLKSGYRTAGLPQEIQKEYNSKFQNYIGQDLTDPNVKRSLVQDIANLKSDSRLRTLAADIKQSALWDAYQQAHPDLAGAAINPYKQGDQWIPAKDDKGNWLNESQVNNWYGNITPYSDFNKMVDDFFGKVKENTKQTIKEENPTASFGVDADGKEYYTTKTTGTDIHWITPDLPQWQAAAQQAEFELKNSSSPEANYFKANYADFIEKDPNFIKNYISTAGGKFVYDRESTSEKYATTKTSGSGSGSKNTEGGKVDPRSETQILQQNTAIPKGELPYNVQKKYELALNTEIINYSKQGYSSNVDENGYEFIVQKPDATPAERSIIDAKNRELRVLQNKKNTSLSIHKALCDKHEFDPNIPLEEQLTDPKLLEKAKEAKFAAENSAIGAPGWEERGKIAFFKALKDDPKFAAYINDLEALQNGIQESNTLAYPLAGSRWEGMRNNVQSVLLKDANYLTDGKKGAIEYLQTNKPVSTEDIETVKSYIAEKGANALDAVTAVIWDREKGEYAAMVTVPTKDGKSINLKIGSSEGTHLLPSISTAARELDVDYNDDQRVRFRDTYQQYENDTYGLNGIIKHPSLSKAIVTTHLPTTEKLPGGVTLKQGETVFTLPELPNVLLKMGSFDKLYDLLTFYNNPNNHAVIKDPQALLNQIRSFEVQDIPVPDKIFNKYEKKIRTVKQDSPK